MKRICLRTLLSLAPVLLGRMVLGVRCRCCCCDGIWTLRTALLGLRAPPSVVVVVLAVDGRMGVTPLTVTADDAVVDKTFFCCSFSPPDAGTRTY